MNIHKTNIAALLAIAAMGLITATTTTSFADTEMSFYGTYEGQDTSGDDMSGTFSDLGNYSVFEEPIVTDGTYEFVLDPTHEDGGYYVTKYVLSDSNGNSLKIESKEITFIEYANGKLGLSISQWKVVEGEGKFKDASGEGMDKTVFNLDDFSYKGMMSGTLNLAS